MEKGMVLPRITVTVKETVRETIREVVTVF